MRKAFVAASTAVTALVFGFVGVANAAPTPPDVGDTAGPVLSAGFTSVLAAFTDLAPWIIPVGLAVLIVRRAVSKMSRGKAPGL